MANQYPGRKYCCSSLVVARSSSKARALVRLAAGFDLIRRFSFWLLRFRLCAYITVPLYLPLEHPLQLLPVLRWPPSPS